MNAILWILQILLAVYFFITGVIHFIVPPGLPEQLAWMYELSPGLHYISGGAEILGALGLTLPGLTRIQTRLTPLAAFGLVLVMIGALIWHFPRAEAPNMVMNLVLAGLLGFIAYGRWRLRPLEGREN
jgi:uncharacterized membrane protein